MLGLKKFKRNRSVLEEKQWDRAQDMHAHDFMELHASSFVERGVTPMFMRVAMMLCAQPSSASVAEQGACGWSKVGCIETEKRSRILTGKTNMLVNVNGWQWSLEEDKQHHKRPHTLQLFDALDELVREKQSDAVEKGVQEGEDDVQGATADADMD